MWWNYIVYSLSSVKQRTFNSDWDSLVRRSSGVDIIGIASDVRPAVPLSAFRFRSRSWKPLDGFLYFCTHTSRRGCRCTFWGWWNFTILNDRPWTIISFNMPDIWPHIVSRADLGNSWVDLFDIAHTSLRGCSCAFFEGLCNYFDLLNLLTDHRL